MVIMSIIITLIFGPSLLPYSEITCSAFLARGLRVTLRWSLLELIAISFSEIRIIQRALNKSSTFLGVFLTLS